MGLTLTRGTRGRRAPVPNSGGYGGGRPRRSWVGRLGRALGWLVSAVVVGAALLFLTPAYYWVARPLIAIDPLQKAPALVVLSGGLNRDGSLGGNTEERVAHAATLYKRGYAPLIIMSGGGVGLRVTDADRMATYARSLGIPADAIITEPRSATTYENALFSAVILNERGIRHIVLVTSPYHSYRSRLMFASRGIRVTSAPAENSGFYQARFLARAHYIKLVAAEYVKLLLFKLGRM